MKEFNEYIERKGNAKLKLLFDELNEVDGIMLEASFYQFAADLNKYVPMQKCPKCDGQGIVSKPPHVAGDVNEWTSSEPSFQCDVCNGAKIISYASI